MMNFYKPETKIGKGLTVFAVIIGLAAGTILISKKEKQIEINPNKSVSINGTGIPENSGFLAGAEKDWEKKIDELLKNRPLNLNPPEYDPGNLTDRMTAALAQKIIELNKDRRDNRQGMRVPKIIEFVPQFIKQGLTDEEYDFSAGKDFEPAKIKISKDNGKKAIREYLNGFKSIIDRSFSFSDKLVKEIVRDAHQSGDFTEFDELLIAYDYAIKEFYALTVPSGWAELHKEEINLLISTKKILEALRRPEKDYLKSTLAVRGYYLVAFQSLDLKKKINDKVAADKIWKN